MERTPIRHLEEKTGKEVLLKGWIHEIRDQRNIKFILLRDWNGIVQTIAFKDNEKVFDSIAKLPKETCIEIKGKVQKANVKNEEVSEKSVEVLIDEYKVLAQSDTELPIQIVKGKDEADLSTRLDWRCVDLRKPKNRAVFKIQATLIEGMTNWLNKHGFIQVFTPGIIGVASESGSEMFTVEYFNRKAFLRQDPQLHRQLTIAGGIEKLYDIGPSWRAEQSHTVKHLCEHRTCAVEFAFIKDEIEVMRVEEQVVMAALKRVNEKCKHELEVLGIELNIPEVPFPELRFPEVYDILEKHGKNIRGEDLDSEAERIIWEYVKEHYNSEFYFINRFPSKIKPFYVMKVDEDPEHARSIDLYWRGLEMSSGGQREHRYQKIIQQVDEQGMTRESVEWFSKFFKYGVPPHGGFAIGIERLTQALLRLGNIREAALFPRDTDRLKP